MPAGDVLDDLPRRTRPDPPPRWCFHPACRRSRMRSSRRGRVDHRQMTDGNPHVPSADKDAGVTPSDVKSAMDLIKPTRSRTRPPARRRPDEPAHKSWLTRRHDPPPPSYLRAGVARDGLQPRRQASGSAGRIPRCRWLHKIREELTRSKAALDRGPELTNSPADNRRSPVRTG